MQANKNKISKWKAVASRNSMYVTLVLSILLRYFRTMAFCATFTVNTQVLYLSTASESSYLRVGMHAYPLEYTTKVHLLKQWCQRGSPDPQGGRQIILLGLANGYGENNKITY